MSLSEDAGRVRDQLAAALAALEDLAGDIDEQADELEALHSSYSELEEQFELANVEWRAPVEEWHDEVHAGAFRFCDERPCDVLRRLAGPWA